MTYLEQYSNYLASKVYKKNENYNPENHTNILNEKIQKYLSKEIVEETERQKLLSLLKWSAFVIGSKLIVLIIALANDNPLDFKTEFVIMDWVLIILTIISMLYAYYVNIKMTYISLLLVVLCFQFKLW